MENKADIRDRGNERGFKQVCLYSLPGILLLCTFNDVVFLFLLNMLFQLLLIYFYLCCIVHKGQKMCDITNIILCFNFPSV